AAAPQAKPPAPPAEDKPPPTIDGIYLDEGACPGEACYLKDRIKAYQAVDLFDQPGPQAARVGRIAAREWVEVVTTENRLVPVRGVVREGRRQFATGDIVYRLGSQGEGCFTVFSGGKTASWCDPEASDPETNEAVDWEQPPQDLLGLAGF